ncbi:MAG: pyridine nucleotide-disulfide oxidoreductase, partial [Methylophilaceae bacterium 17-44-8]
MQSQTLNFDIVIVGGGSAGCGVAASLLKRDATLSLAIIEPSTQHYYQPAWTLVGAGEFEASDSVRDMATCIPKGATWLKAAVTTF